jgi:arylsulfatase A-like enzyme
VRSLYDGDIAANDEAFGALLRRLKDLGLYDRMLIVLVADHGEEFMEHGAFEHGRTLFQEQLHVPLIIRYPGGAPRGEPAGLARQIDVVPTVLRAAGLPIPSGLPGAPLEPRGEGAVESFAETSLGGGTLTALFTPEGKVIHSLRRTEDRFQVYDLVHDPDEQHDLAAERPILLGYVRQSFAQRAVSIARPVYGQGGDETLDDETARRLRALGYVDH